VELPGEKLVRVTSLFVDPCGDNKFLQHCRRISVPYPFQWGAPTFDAAECFAMMMASFVALVEVCVHLFT
jgi:hypothetical protein